MLYQKFVNNGDIWRSRYTGFSFYHHRRLAHAPVYSDILSKWQEAKILFKYIFCWSFLFKSKATMRECVESCRNYDSFQYRGMILLWISTVTVQYHRMVFQLIHGYRKNDGFVNWGNTQHMALVMLFCFQSLVEILVHNNINVPHNMNYIACTIAFAFEAFIFSQHLHGREMVDTQVLLQIFLPAPLWSILFQMHVTIVVLAAICAILLALEMQNRNSMSLALTTRFVIILQGVWLVEIGFVIFPPSKYFESAWSLMDHSYSEWLSATLGFEAAFILLFILFTWLLFAMLNGQLFNSKHSGSIEFNEEGYTLLQEQINNNGSFE